MKRLLLLFFIAGCSASTPEATEVLGDVHYTSPPSTWRHRDTKEISRLISRWNPEQNDNKESISIIRTSAQGPMKGASTARIETILEEAQKVLPRATVQRPTVAKTKQNLEEVEIVADYIPAGMKTSYHRVHAMILDGDVLIHVLYTARTPDPSLVMFRQIVDSVRRGEG